MSVLIEMRRHSIKDGDAQRRTIGERGRALARLVGQEQLRGRHFTRYFVSPLERTRQTLAAMAEGAADFGPQWLKAQVAPIYLFWEDLKPLWKACHLAERAGGDMVETAWVHDAALTAAAQKEYLTQLRDFAETLHHQDRVLVIGHSPHLELLAHAITGVKATGLKECDGYTLRYSLGRFWMDGLQLAASTAQLRAQFDRA